MSSYFSNEEMDIYMIAMGLGAEFPGYKFYDIDGNPVPSVQNDGTPAASLVDILGLRENAEENNNSVIIDDMTEEGAAPPADIQSDWPSDRIKLLDAECAKVRRQLEEEIFRSKAALKLSLHTPCDDNTSEEVQKFIYQEKLKLYKDKETVKNFRKLVEEKLLTKQ